MKRTRIFQIFILSTTFLIGARCTYAQAGMKIGIVAGENFANAQTLPAPPGFGSVQGSTGYVLGIRTDKDLFAGFSLQTELLVSERSFQTSGNAQSWAENITYLQIPFLLKFSPIPGPIQPYLYLGPDIGIKLSASLDSNAVSSADQGSIFNSLDLGLDVGAGIQGQVLPILWLFVEARYSYGLTDVYSNVQQSGASNLGDLRSRDIKWLAGVMIGF